MDSKNLKQKQKQQQQSKLAKKFLLEIIFVGDSKNKSFKKFDINYMAHGVAWNNNNNNPKTKHKNTINI